jgi:hypothetical protein
VTGFPASSPSWRFFSTTGPKAHGAPAESAIGLIQERHQAGWARIDVGEQVVLLAVALHQVEQASA